MKTVDPWTFSPGVTIPNKALLPARFEELSFEPTLSKLELFAYGEFSEPDMSTAEAAEFLAIPVETFNWAKHRPQLLAKWRFAVAAAMIAESKRHTEEGTQ